MDVNLRVHLRPDQLLGSHHHGPLHARIGNITHDIEDDESLLELNDLLIGLLPQLVMLMDDHGWLHRLRRGPKFLGFELCFLNYLF